MRNRFAIIFVLVQVAITAALFGGLYVYLTRAQPAPGDGQAVLPGAAYADSMKAPTSGASYRANPGRTGYYDSRAIEAFSGITWQRQSPGTITSDPTVTGGRLFVGSGAGELVCIDTMTSAEIWKFKTMRPVQSTPAVAGGAVYFASDAFYCLDAATGAVRWSSKAAASITGYGDRSPLVAGETVFFTGGNTLFALDAGTGATKWAFPTGEAYLEGPALADGMIFFGGGGELDEPAVKHSLYALDAATGKEKWRHEVDGIAATSPVATGGLVYFGTTGIVRQGGGDPRFPSTGSVNGSLIALDSATGEERWRYAASSLLKNPPIIMGGLIVLAETVESPEMNKGFIRALDAKTGAEVWSMDTGPVSSSPTGSGTTAYVVAGETATQTQAQTRLIAIDIVAGKERWGFAMPVYGGFSGPVFDKDVMYLVADRIYAFQ